MRAVAANAAGGANSRVSRITVASPLLAEPASGAFGEPAADGAEDRPVEGWPVEGWPVEDWEFIVLAATTAIP